MLPSILNCKYINEMSSLLSLFQPQPHALYQIKLWNLLDQIVQVRNIKCVQCTLHNILQELENMKLGQKLNCFDDVFFSAAES